MTTASTELDAVNVILGSIGEPPVNSIDADVPSDAANARLVLLEHSRELQTRGWYWNTDTDVTLSRNSDHRVTLPADTLHVDFRLPSYVLRGRDVYDRVVRSYALTQDVVADRVITFLPIERMPEAARRFLTLRSAAVFQARYLGSGQLAQANALEEARAWAQVLQDELRVEKPNMLSAPTVSNILARF